MNAPSILASCIFATLFLSSPSTSAELRKSSSLSPSLRLDSEESRNQGSRTNAKAPQRARRTIPDRVRTYRTRTSSTHEGKVNEKPPVRVLIIGDSMAATDFGRELQKKLRRRDKTKCFRKGKSSTGLARPDFYDWMSEGKRQIRKTKPDVVIVIVGGNDGQDLIDKAKKKRRIFWRGKKWEASYAQRINDFVTLLKEPERHVLWLELPAMDRQRLERKLKLIREVQKAAIEDIGDRTHYVRTAQHFYDSSGKLIRKIRDLKKRKKVPLRQEDGIHFSLAGSKYFADRVFKQVDEILTAID